MLLYACLYLKSLRHSVVALNVVSLKSSPGVVTGSIEIYWKSSNFGGATNLYNTSTWCSQLNLFFRWLQWGFSSAPFSRLLNDLSGCARYFFLYCIQGIFLLLLRRDQPQQTRMDPSGTRDLLLYSMSNNNRGPPQRTFNPETALEDENVSGWDLGLNLSSTTPLLIHAHAALTTRSASGQI